LDLNTNGTPDYCENWCQFDLAIFGSPGEYWLYFNGWYFGWTATNYGFPAC